MSDKPSGVADVTLAYYRGYTIHPQTAAGYWGCRYYRNRGFGHGWIETVHGTREGAVGAAKQQIDEAEGPMPDDKPTEADPIKQQLRNLQTCQGDLLESLGELRIGLDELTRKVGRLERQQNILIRQRSDMIHRDVFGILEDKVNAHLPKRTMIGSIDGLEGVWTVTPPPEFEV